MAYPDIEQPLKEVGPVVRGNLFKQRQVEQQQRMETAKQSPVADNAQMLVDAARINKPAPTTPVQTPQPVAKQTYSIPNVNPQSPTDGMDLLSSMYTSPEQEEKYRKAALANQRITAVADALRHIGNIYNTVNYAPAQQLNNATQVEADRYLKGKALRDQANMRYLTYQQQKAAQDARIKQYERDYALKMEEAARKAGYTEAQIKNMQDRLEEQRANNEANRALREKLGLAQQEERVRHNKVSEHQGQQRIGIAATNSRNAENHRKWVRENKGKGGNRGVAPLDTPKGMITPNGRSYSNQLLQMFDYAKSQGLVQETDVAKRLRELGFGKDQSDNVKRQMVMDLLRSNPALGDYAASRLGWSYGNGGTGSNWDEYAEEEDDWSQYED